MQNIQFRPNTCQVKYRMRAVASFNKLAGFPKMSGYKQANLVGPNMMALNTQVKHIVDHMTTNFDEFRETRKQVLR